MDWPCALTDIIPETTLTIQSVACDQVATRIEVMDNPRSLIPAGRDIDVFITCRSSDEKGRSYVICIRCGDVVSISKNLPGSFREDTRGYRRMRQIVRHTTYNAMTGEPWAFPRDPYCPPLL